MKKGKLTLEEKYKILQSINEDKSLDEIAEELDRSKKQVLEYTGELAEIASKSLATPAAPPKKPTTRFKKIMDRTGKSENGTNKAAVMTSAASMIADEQRRRSAKNNGVNPKFKGTIYRPKSGETD